MRAFSPEAMAPITGIAPATVREVARLYASSRASMILWGMGVSQHVHGTDNARCLIALALMTGQIGRPGTGLHPLRGQNNVQGASDAGLIPMMYPDYQSVEDPAARQRWATAVGCAAQRLAAHKGLTVVEVMHAIRAGQVKGLYIMGENPAMSDPDASHARAVAGRAGDAGRAGPVPHRDRGPGRRGAACFGVCREDRQLHQHRPPGADRSPRAGPARPGAPGPVDPDGDGTSSSAWTGPPTAPCPADCDVAAAAVFDEMRQAMPSIAGITWRGCRAEGAVTYPCRQEGDAGEPVVFIDDFPTPAGVRASCRRPCCRRTNNRTRAFPLVLITGRQLEHWHTGSMTRRSAVLDAIEPDPVVLIHPQDLAQLGARPGDLVTLQSRRGEVSLYARADEGTPPGVVFVAFCWFEAAVNQLTNAALDPVAKIPEFKYCAVRLRAGGRRLQVGSFGGGPAAGADGGRAGQPKAKTMATRGIHLQYRFETGWRRTHQPARRAGAEPAVRRAAGGARARFHPACGACHRRVLPPPVGGPQAVGAGAGPAAGELVAGPAGPPDALCRPAAVGRDPRPGHA
jgi:formate dehydrogenase major subunit